MNKSRSLLSVNDIHGAWAIMPTPARDDAGDWRVEDSLDVDETARIAEALVTSGVDGILSLGTFGECATLSWDEKRRFIATAAEVIADRVPFFVGTSSLNTRETIRQTREAYALGARGTMLGLPMWCTMDLVGAVQYYRDIAEACPEMAICIYANTEAFRFDFPRPFWAQVAQIPQVVSAKYLGIGALVPDLTLTQGRIRFMPVEIDYYAAARISPELCTAFWSSSAVCGPAPVLKLRDEVAKAKHSGDWTQAKAVSDAMTRAMMPMIPNGSMSEFGKYNIGLEKERMNAAGWCKAGPTRPPYQQMPKPYLEGTQQAGRAWADLHRQYSAA